MLAPGTFALTLLLAGISAIGPLSTDMYLPSMPNIAETLSTTPSQVQLTISSYLMGFAVGQIIYGPVSDRHGRKPVILISLGVFFAAALMCYLSTSIEMLIGARFLQAVGASGGIVLARAVIRDLYSGNRAGREMSVMASVMALAPVVAPMIGGAVQWGFGWRAIFLILLLACAINMVVVWWLLPETNKLRAAEPISLRSVLTSFRIVIRNPVYLAYLAMSSAIYAGLFAWLSGSAFLLQGVYGLTPLAFGFMFAVGSLGYLTGSFIAAHTVTRLGLDAVLGIGACCAAIGGLGMVTSILLHLPSALFVVVPIAVFLAGLGMVLPQSLAGALTPFPERAGAASSLFGFIQQTAAAVWGALGGIFLGHDAWLVGAMVAFMGVATLLIWIATRDLRKRHAYSYKS